MEEGAAITVAPASSSPSRMRPSRQESPELFTEGLWPTLQRPHASIFGGRGSPSRELEDAGSGSSASAARWYELQVKRHMDFKVVLSSAERTGMWMGAVCGVATLVVPVNRWRLWNLPCVCCSHLDAAECASQWDGDDEQRLLREAYVYGASKGLVVHLAFWLALFLVATIVVGVSNSDSSQALTALIIVDVVCFLGIVVASCYSGHKRKRSEYQAILAEELPRNVPSVLQLEIAQRNARVMQALLQAERRHPPDTGGRSSAIQLAREDRAISSEIEKSFQSVRQRHRTEDEAAAALRLIDFQTDERDKRCSNPRDDEAERPRGAVEVDAVDVPVRDVEASDDDGDGEAFEFDAGERPISIPL